MTRFFIYITLFLAANSFGQMIEHAIPLVTNDIVYDAVTNKIYASISSTNGENGNSIGIINPTTYELESTISIEGEPGVLAISDNGKYIYAALKNVGNIIKLNVETQTIDLNFSLGIGKFDRPYYAKDIEVMPGNDSAIAVSRCYSGYTEFGGVAIYDDGVARTNVMNDNPGTGLYASSIEFKNSSVLLGYANEHIPSDFARLTVNSTGITNANVAPELPFLYYSTELFYPDFIYHDNYAYFRNGAVVNLTTGPVISGQFQAAGPVTYDTANNYVCFAYNTFEDFYPTVNLKRFNPSTLLPQDSFVLTETHGLVKNLITCGEGCYALSAQSQVAIIKSTSTAGIEDNNISVVSLYPNPSSDIVNISLNGNETIKEAIVFNIEGKAVSTSFFNNTIDIHNLSKGLYLVKLTDENDNTYTKKIVKI